MIFHMSWLWYILPTTSLTLISLHFTAKYDQLFLHWYPAELFTMHIKSVSINLLWHSWIKFQLGEFFWYCLQKFCLTVDTDFVKWNASTQSAFSGSVTNLSICAPSGQRWCYLISPTSFKNFLGCSPQWCLISVCLSVSLIHIYFLNCSDNMLSPVYLNQHTSSVWMRVLCHHFCNVLPEFT
jgi:hypothetical protein